jgi:SAM-dependent methyltransferase
VAAAIEPDVDEGVQVCRSCGDTRLVPVLDLGSTPIANALVDPGTVSADPRYPLAVVLCQGCSLVQLERALPAGAIFDSDYPYYSSYSDALCRHARSHVEQLVTQRGLGPDSFAVEVASNDGYLLRHFVDAGVGALGIDPSPGPAAAAIAAGVPTRVEFFGACAASAIVAQHGHADVVIANNVMAHVPDLDDFVSGLATLLADDGILTIENPSVADLVEHCEFDTIYHEHYSYFSCSSVDALMRRHGLHLNDVEYFPDLHGGTLRWYVAHHRERTQRCQERLDRERADGVTSPAFYRSFAARVRQTQSELRRLLDELHESGARVAAYGAAAKGATLLNSSGVGADRVAYVVDRNEHKQGRAMPGCRIPIAPVERLQLDPPDYLLLLAWNFADEIMAQQAAYRAGGGRFIIPVPSPRIV